MSSKEELYYLLCKYIEGEFNTEIFCDMFTVTYCIETDYSVLNNQEKLLFEELSVLTARFSPYEDDLSIPNVYVNEQEIKGNALKVYSKLVK